MASYVERLTKIRDSLESTAESIGTKDYVSDDDGERADAYEAAIEAINEAIAALEDLA